MHFLFQFQTKILNYSEICAQIPLKFSYFEMLWVSSDFYGIHCDSLYLRIF